MSLERCPEPGETVTGGRLSRGPGGKGSNQAIAIARLGHAVSLITAVGADDAATSARTLWETEGVDASGVVTTAEPTMTGVILVDRTGDNRIAIAPGALDALAPEDIERSAATIAAADLVVVSAEIPHAVIEHTLAVARREGTRSILNPAPAWRIDAPGADLITPNASEARIMLGLAPDADADDADLAMTLARRLDAHVVLTRGPRGALVVADGELQSVDPVVPARVVDTTGAGDAFTAALAVALVEGADLVTAARWAAAAGAHAVGIAEAVPSLPQRRDLPNLTRTSMETHA
jgi:ribokinase